MAEKVVPMIHVPDVRAAVNWYRNIGFTVLNTYGDDGDGLSFAILSFGTSEIIFNQGGQPSTRDRREVDLYVYADNVDEIYARLKDRVEVVEEPHDTFYGMREFIIRDLNRFWMTFGQPSTFTLLMSATKEANIESVRRTLDRGGLKPEMLSAALAVASSGDNKSFEIRAMLKQAGAESPPEVVARTLQSHVGKYKGEQGFEINVTLRDGKLFAALGAQEPLSLMAVDQTTFTPIAFDNYGVVTFDVVAGKTVSCALKHEGHTMQLKRDPND